MKSFAEVAKYAGQIGLVLFVLFALVKGLLALKIFSQITSEHTYRLLNKLINVVLIILMTALIAILAGKCSKENANPNITINTPSMTPPSFEDLNPVDTNKYTITFDEIKIMYQGLNVPQRAKNYRICFQAQTSQQTIEKLIEQRLGSFLPEWDAPTPISLRGVVLKDVKSSEGCTLQIGFDGTKNVSCTKDAAILFESNIGSNEFKFANNLNSFPPINMEMSNFRLQIKYRIAKQIR